MFFKILKRDLKRKKSMNVILLLFMILIGMLVAGSTNMLNTVTNALDNFMEKSNLADFMVVSFSDDESNAKIQEWAENSESVKEYTVDDTISITEDNITFPKAFEEYEGTILALATQTNGSNIIFDNSDEVLSIKDGEIAIPTSLAEATNLKVGDKLPISFGEYSKEFVVKTFTKDVAFGSAMMGFKRLVVSQKDYDFLKNAEDKHIIRIWSCSKTDSSSYADVEKGFGKYSTNKVVVQFTATTIKTTYLIDLVMVGMMIIVSIFLMLISFLIFRFTIIFTFQEEYKAIGIMKAIGLKNRKIGNLYLAKYSFMSVLGTSIGFFLSFPFANKMMSSISKNIIIEKSTSTVVLSFLSLLFVTAITLLFCKLCTRKINKYSAIDAIRNGTTGERFSKSKKINLHKCKRTKVPLFLAFSDLMNGWKQFIVLTLTFIFGTFLIIVPINVINTLSSPDIVRLMSYPKTDVFIGKDNAFNPDFYKDENSLLTELRGLENKYNAGGENVKLHTESYFSVMAWSDDISINKLALSLKGYDFSTDNYDYLDGIAPKLANEIAITEKMAEYLGVGIGDTIHCKVGDESHDYIITATFQSMLYLGYSFRFSELAPLDISQNGGVQFCGNFVNSNDIDKSIENLSAMTPEYKIKTSSEFASTLIGNTDQLLSLKSVVLLLILGINCLITILIVKMMISKEVSEIAILKSMGFKNISIKCWQIARVSIVLIASVIIGALVANNFGGVLVKGIFSVVGIGHIKMTIIPQQVYLFYPAIVLGITLLAVMLSLGQIKRIKVWEINNQD